MVGQAPRALESARGGASAISEDAFRPFEIASIASREGICPVRESCVAALRFGVLRSFSRPSSTPRRVLVVAPLAGGYPIVLRDLVIGLLRELSEVAITDWPDARYVPKGCGAFGLADNILHVEEMMRRLGPELHVVAVCQGVVPALAATALLSASRGKAAPLSLTLIGGPVDPLANPSRVVRLLRGRSLGWFRQNVLDTVGAAYPGRGRRIYSRTRQLETLSAYALRHIVNGGELFWKMLLDDGEDPVRFPFSSLCWSLMDIPAELLLDTVREVFHRSSLARGTLSAEGRRIDLRTIRRTALMTIEGEEDDIAALGQTSAAHALCPSIPEARRRRLVVPQSGHFSLFHGEIARRTVLPAIVELIEDTQRRKKLRGSVPRAQSLEVA
ncbi:MAG: polyhydroxyalkanoate depolymerase [Hyphomicrobiales bacterium]